MNPNIQKSRERTEKILITLDELGFASRSQLQSLHNLGTKRNANRVLKGMSQYLNSYRDIENIYYLNKTGREKIGSDKIRSKAMNTTHTIMRNDIYIFFNQPKEWVIEPTVSESYGVHPDVLFKNQNLFYFLEVDNTQKMKVNEEKLKNYLEFKESHQFQKRFGSFPKIIFYTTTEYRKAKLFDFFKKYELNATAYTKEDLR